MIRPELSLVLIFIVVVVTAYDANDDEFNFSLEDENVDWVSENLKIAGGDVTTIENNRYHCLIKIANTTTNMCAGTIISPKWILTAGHCIFGVDPSAVTVRVGTSILDSGGSIVNVASLTVHSLFSNYTFDYDYGLIKLNESLVFGPTIYSAVLPSEHYRLPIYPIAAIGWGLTSSTSGSYSSLLRSVLLQRIKTPLCGVVYGNRMAITSRMFCVGKLIFGGQGACKGDSGGAAIFNGVVIGIASVGMNCGDAMSPSVYARVSVATPWIQGVTGISTAF
ncbi:trypsin-7-like [Arctopsyche grandis]|uniref:trypsin-7-like n=1 Tax=Arctopsyche grandis TaxID=121162 RepID=UPI00406D9EE5